MSQLIHLDTTLLLVTPITLNEAGRHVIAVEDFASPEKSLKISNDALGKELNAFAMKEMALAKLPVGIPKELVEFYTLDIKRDKKAVSSLERICSLAWLRAVQCLEMVREQTGEAFLSAALAAPVERVVEVAHLRRFLCNAS